VTPSARRLEGSPHTARIPSEGVRGDVRPHALREDGDTFARFLRDESAPWGRSEEDRGAFLAMVSESWGTGVSAELLAPSLAADTAFRERFARMERMAASPGRARMLLEIAFSTDVRAVLPSICVRSGRGSRLDFDARGRHALKGVPGEWTLLAARV
jgi:hypothetical protein